MKINTIKKRKKTLVIIVVTCVALGIAGGVLAWQLVQSNNSAPQTTNDPPAVNDVNYGPPSETDISEGQDGKKSTYEQNTSESNDNTDSSKKSVAVGVSYADMYNNKLEIRAFTNGVIEGSGSCTATATKGSTVITETTTAFIDSSTTQCNPIYIEASRLSSGTWDVVVKFSSNSAEGTSDIIKVTIP